ncbi:MAG: hypothetical protein AB1603_08040, partial [Chloroflexota bacterium]
RVGAELLYPSLFDDVLYRIRGLTDYRAFLIREGREELLTFEVELVEHHAGTENQVVQAVSALPAIRRCLDNGYLSALGVKIVEYGQLRRAGRSKQRIVDNRPTR